MTIFKSQIKNQKSPRAEMRIIAPPKAQGWPSLGLRRNHASPAGSGFTLVELPAVSKRQRFAFTLVELLVTVSVIAILATLLLGALYSAQDTARAQKTRSTIAKLHTMMMTRWETYKTRRVPVDIAAVIGNPNDPAYTYKAARLRLDALRELMRMEMPDRYSDIVDDPVTVVGAGPTFMARPSISQAYLRKKSTIPTGYTATTYATGQYAGAECLYLILTMGQTDEETERQQFGASEVGDVDADGMPEFLDAWGQPIRFLRWAPAFVSELQTCDPSKQPDSFDPRRVYPTTSPPAQNQATFALYPLIYSAGPDKHYDIVSDIPGPLQYSTLRNNPFNSNQIGSPQDTPQEAEPANGENEWADNIHNHLIGSR